MLIKRLVEVIAGHHFHTLERQVIKRVAEIIEEQLELVQKSETSSEPAELSAYVHLKVIVETVCIEVRQRGFESTGARPARASIDLFEEAVAPLLSDNPEPRQVFGLTRFAVGVVLQKELELDGVVSLAARLARFENLRSHSTSAATARRARANFR